MPATDSISRRRALGTTLALGAALATRLIAPSPALAAVCRLTPAQSEGPFYPPAFGRPGNDLLVAGADNVTAAGEVIHVAGRVLDAQCRPVPGAVVEIWQADAHGRYHHPYERDKGPPDPNFRYWGRAVADAEGRYRFRTVRPAPYRMGWGWRTPHVHFKVRGPGRNVLTTQMYFAGHELNPRDGLLSDLDEPARAAVVAQPHAAGGAPTEWRFDIALT